MNPTEQARLAVDIGGTFTDVVLDVPGRGQFTTKCLTTYDHPGRAVLDGIRQVMADASISAEEVGLIIHGTTLATNALIERRGARTALLTTDGHRDALQMAHEDRFEQYDIMIDRPRPLVPRYLRLPVRERLNAAGGVLIPLNEQDVHDALDVLDRHEVESVAIGFLHAFVNPDHEHRTAEIIREQRPDLSLTLACEVCPEIREYERLSTACANAYVQPLMASYLHRLHRELKQLGYDCPFLLMTSGGGLTTLETAAQFPIRLVESGPAGGAILAQAIARMKGLQKVLAFDMGGTTAKLCLIDDFEPLTSRSFEVDRTYRFKKGSGLPVRIPVIEMVEIGAGGGSIASVDHLERIQVGPESAGSEPGPAAFGRGGKQAAVTDADVCLGRIMMDGFAGGAFSLDQLAATNAVRKHVADVLDLDVDTAALGISEVVDENMAAAARAHAAEFGLDLASRDMIAFGGAAPLHAIRLGEKLGVQRIIIPAGAGVGSAVGFLLAPVAYEVVRSRQQRLDQFDAERVNALMHEMREEAWNVVKPAVQDQPLKETRHAYMRYVGQGHEIAVEIPSQDYRNADAAQIRDRFESAYRRLYGRTIDGVAIEVLSWTLTMASTQAARLAGNARGKADEATAPPDDRDHRLFDPGSGRWVAAEIHQRSRLNPNQVIEGPALVREDQTTTVLSPGWQARMDDAGHLELLRQERTEND